MQNLFKIKSLFSLAAILIMITAIFKDVPEWIQSIVLMIVAFYFGKQSSEIPPK